VAVMANNPYWLEETVDTTSDNFMPPEELDAWVKLHMRRRSRRRNIAGRSESRCKQCGESIVWVQLHSGKWLPCDPGVKTIATGKDGEARVVQGYVPHFLTCPAIDGDGDN